MDVWNAGKPRKLLAMIRVPHNKVAVVPITDPDMTASGLLVIPDVAKQRCDQGIVKYVGDSVQEIKVGDYVLFSGYSGTVVIIEGEGEFIILPEEFVTCRIDPPDTDIAGLYFRSREGEYFTATYEMVASLMARAYEDMRMPTRLKHVSVIDSRPKKEEYDKLRGG
jgi:co-chaperonin GroES (HSP10)